MSDTIAERRRYAVLQAASAMATNYMSLPTKSQIMMMVDTAEALLAEIEKREDER